MRVKPTLDANNIWAGASFMDTIVVPNDTSASTHISKGEEDIVLVQLDLIGNMLFSFQLGGSNRDLLQELTADSSSRIFLAGTFRDTLPTDSSINPSGLISKGDADIFLIASSPTGSIKAAHSIGSSDFDEVTGLDLSLKGAFKKTLFLGGNFSGTVDLGKDDSQQTVTLTSNDFKDSYLAWYNLDDFTLDGFEQIGDSGATVGLDLKVLPDKDPNTETKIVITGRSSGALHLPPFPGQMLCSNARRYLSKGSFDLFSGKLPILIDPNTNIDGDILPYSIKVFPNPASDFLEIQANGDIGLSSRVSLQIFNIEGKNLISQQISLASNNRVSVKSLAQGIYLLRILDSKGQGN